jgi:hypothetical protein
MLEFSSEDMVGILEKPIEPVGPIEPIGPIVETSSIAQKRIKRLERPNKAQLEEEVAKVFDEIDGIQGRIYEIKSLIDNKHHDKHASSGEVQEARNKLSELTSSFRSVMDEKKLIREELDHADKHRERMRADARSLRDKLPYVRVEQIDDEIRKLEYTMTHTSLSLQEEKKLMQQVKELSKSRDFVKDYSDKLDQITLDESSRGDFMDRIRAKDAILNDLRAKQEEQRNILAKIKERDSSQQSDIPALIEERNAAFEKVKVLREQVKELKADFRGKEEEYWERERQFKEQQAIQRRKDYEKREAERKERDKIRKEREAENFVEPYTDEIIMIDQLSSYLLKYAPAAEDASASAAPQKAEIVAPKGVGTVLVSKKNKFDEETDSWFSGKSKGRKNKAPAATKSKAKEKITLSLDALTSFQKVKLTPPTTVGDVTKSLEDLKLKKEDFSKLQFEAKARRERGEPEPKVAKDEPAKTVEVLTPQEASVIDFATPTPAEAQSRVTKLSKGVESESVVEVGPASEENGEDKVEDERVVDVGTALKENGEDKVEEEQEPKVQEDVKSSLPEDLDSKLPEDLEAKLPADLESKLPEDLETKQPEEVAA